MPALSNTQKEVGFGRSHCRRKHSDRPSTQVPEHNGIGQEGSEGYLRTRDTHRWGLCSTLTEAYFVCSDVGKFRTLCVLVYDPTDMFLGAS